MTDNDILSQIKGLTADSRMARRGWLFAALPGSRAEGVNFIKDAIINGATHILAPLGTVLPADQNAVLILDEDVRRRFALLAASFYKLQPATTVAVTGTNGKTSTVTFTAQLWDALGFSAASLGTLGISSRLTMKKGGLTTPDPVTLHAELADLTAAGITHLAMEASSIGVDQRRLDGVTLKAAAFTNLTHDHLDYHGTMDAYYTCKERLFKTLLPEGASAVVHIDDAYGERLAKTLEGKRPLLRIGRQASEITILKQTPTPFGQILDLNVFGKNFTLNLPLVGLFQGLNALVAAGLVMATDKNISFEKLMPHLEKLSVVPGRLQLVAGHKRGAAVYIDYAHTPHGLETVLKAVRPHTAGRLHVIFGCGGDRDKSKRPVMGGIAAALADVVIITDDNPRTEDAKAIRAEVAAGAPHARVIDDRKIAIFEAISSLLAGDVLVIAGKGHEQGQIVGDIVHPFDDVKVAEEAIHAL
ncbi:MAG: UDP-N-acetylmuramoyl-L-alanyl-D-glutamate--2,6-diaminopimelate ligase [Proteobacteria bacterium]|nr:UDP-N-acetylmuramoyl-L-alanyl-D-glutamate--2,6-diaminopimelate ligase [Pseudomonadota bacterium]